MQLLTTIINYQFHRFCINVASGNVIRQAERIDLMQQLHPVVERQGEAARLVRVAAISLAAILCVCVCVCVCMCVCISVCLCVRVLY